MSALFYLIPISLGLGLAALICFLWTLKDGQYEDMEGAAHRILTDEDRPLLPGQNRHPPSEGLDPQSKSTSAQTSR